MKYQIEIITKTPKIIVESTHPLMAVKDLFYEKMVWDEKNKRMKGDGKATHSIRYKVKNLENGKVFTGQLSEFKLYRDERK